MRGVACVNMKFPHKIEDLQSLAKLEFSRKLANFHLNIMILMYF